MARYNEILVGRFNRLIQKLLSIKGPASLISVEDSMQAVIPLFHGVENRYLEGWGIFQRELSSAAVAGALANGRLRNPRGSKVIAVVEIIFGSAPSPANNELFTLEYGAPLAAGVADYADLTGPLPLINMDARQAGAGASQVGSVSIASAGAPAAALGGFFIGRRAAQNGNMIPFIAYANQELLLLPGAALQIAATQNANLQEFFTFRVRERILEDSEQQ